jgi:hypothetical protein
MRTMKQGAVELCAAWRLSCRARASPGDLKVTLLTLELLPVKKDLSMERPRQGSLARCPDIGDQVIFCCGVSCRTLRSSLIANLMTTASPDTGRITHI